LGHREGVVEPWLFWAKLDGPLEFSNGRVNLLALEIRCAKVAVCFRITRIYFYRSAEGPHRIIEIAGFSACHSDDCIGFVIIGIDGQCSFGGVDRIMVMTLVQVEETDVVPTDSKVRFSRTACEYASIASEYLRSLPQL
jgi:hypothetical protein